MNFKFAYAAFVFVLVVAACGERAEPAAEAATVAADAETLGAPQSTDRPQMKQFAQGVGRIGDALASIRDEASARAAADAINRINAELEPLARTIAGWSDEEQRAAAMAAAGEMVNAQQKVGLASANLAINHPDLLEIVRDEMEKTPTVD